MNEIYRQQLKGITGDGTANPIIKPSTGKRVHKLQLQLTYAAGVNTLVALMTALTTIRVKVGSTKKWELSGTKLRDFCLLFGTTYDFNGLPNTGCQITIPFAPEWFLASVADALAWNPRVLGADISVEIQSTIALTVVGYEFVSDDLDALSAGILTMELIRPVAGGTSFYSGAEFEARGRLYLATIYPDSTNNNEITPASLMLGQNGRFAHESMTSAQNDENLERYSLTPAAAGRSANVYDIISVTGDAIAHAWDLARWGKPRLKIEAAAAMAGTCDILVVRFEDK